VLARERRGREGQGDNYSGRVPRRSRRAEQARRAGRVGRGGVGRGARKSDTCERSRRSSSSLLICRIPESKHHNPDRLRKGILGSVPYMMKFEICIEKCTDQHAQYLLIGTQPVFRQKKDQIRAHTKPDTEMGKIGRYIDII
jgi:hypothetical protein